MASSADQLRAQRLRFLGRAGSMFDHWLARCESPIERLFLAEALNDGWRFPDMSDWRANYDWIRHLHHEAHSCLFFCRDDLPHFPFLVMQMPLELDGRRLRLDFAIVEPEEDRFRVAIELDGHDFHERTREQAESDKSRDRLLQAKGWRVLRFTGSEIVRDVGSCWMDVIRHIAPEWAAAAQEQCQQ